MTKAHAMQTCKVVGRQPLLEEQASSRLVVRFISDIDVYCL